jgi:hypothetical protein
MHGIKIFADCYQVWVSGFWAGEFKTHREAVDCFLAHS